MRELRAIAALITVGTVCLVLAQDALWTTAKTSSAVVPTTIVVPMEEATDIAAEPQEDIAVDTEPQHEAPRRIVQPARRIPVLLPAVDQEDISYKHKTIADETLRSIHAECREYLKNFYVRYDNPEKRGLGGGNTIILSGNVEDDEFRALLIHECGHVIDTGAWQGTHGTTAFSDGGNPIYADDKSIEFYTISWTDQDTKKAGIKSTDFVSGYASWNAFEDFAESFAYYTLHRTQFYERALQSEVLMQKYRFMQRYIVDEEPGVTAFDFTGKVPWDITKLPYAWYGTSVSSTVSFDVR